MSLVQSAAAAGKLAGHCAHRSSLLACLPACPSAALPVCLPACLLSTYFCACWIPSTDRNQHSSRSHAILQFWLEQRPPAGAAAARDSTLVRSKLNFVDLAGSERWGKVHTEAEGGKL